MNDINSLKWNEIVNRIFSIYGAKTNNELAEKLGFSGELVRKWRVKNLKERRYPTWGTLEAVIRKSGKSWDWLLTGAESKGERDMAKCNILSNNLTLLRESCTRADFYTKLKNIGDRYGASDWTYFEAGSKKPDDEVIERIAGYFEVNPDDLKSKALSSNDYPHLVPLPSEWRRSLSGVDNDKEETILKCLEVIEGLSRVARYLSSESAAEAMEALQDSQSHLAALTTAIENLSKQEGTLLGQRDA